ncbi:MAG: MAPEG family protein [Burkholderiales bacterium]|nr:MAPEG family protein [Burkholderiales bacterium]
MSPSLQLALPAFALVILTVLVGLRLLYVRSQEMREKRVHPQAASTSVLMAAKLQNVQAADNFRNLFETPVLFYALVATAIGAHHVPDWLIVGAWVYVALRAVHSFIHCTYNRVMQRFAAFGAGFALLVGLWAAFVIGLAGKTAT